MHAPPPPTVLDLDGNPISTKTVSVNQPLRFGGVTAYQTDWSMSGLQLQVEGSAGLPEGVTFQLPMASLQGEPRVLPGRGGERMVAGASGGGAAGSGVADFAMRDQAFCAASESYLHWLPTP